MAFRRPPTRVGSSDFQAPSRTIAGALASVLSIWGVLAVTFPASAAQGPYGPELQGERSHGPRAFSTECAPDTNGVTVRLIEYYDDADQYRGLIARTDLQGDLVEEPFAYAADPSVVGAWAVACDGDGGFVVVWSIFDHSCLYVRAFDGTGAALAEERHLTPSCSYYGQRLLQLEYGADGNYLAIWTNRSRINDHLREDILFQSLDSRAMGAAESVTLKRSILDGPRAWRDRAARANERAALVVRIRNEKVRGQIVGLDGVAITRGFKVHVSNDSASNFDGIEDLEDGTMIPWWDSYWQAGPIGRKVVVSVTIPTTPTTTTTTLPDDPQVPWFERGSELQALQSQSEWQWAYPPTLAAAGDGTAVAVWTHVDIDGNRQISYSRRDANTGVWTDRRAFPQPGLVAKSWYPRVVTNGNGKWIAMWVQSTPGGCAFVTSTSVDNGLSWSASEVVVPDAFSGLSSTSTCRLLYFNLAAEPDGAWIVVWADRATPTADAPPLLKTSRSVDQGRTWSTPATALVLDNAPWGNVSLAASGDGAWGIVWSTNFATSYADRYETGGQVFFAHSSDDGLTWSEPAVIVGEPGQAVGRPIHNGPDIATDGSGQWLVAWSSDDTLDGELADRDILLSRSLDDGASWSSPEHVAAYATDDRNHDSSPSIASDHDGGWLLAWSTSIDLPGAAGLDFDIAVAYAEDAGEAWTTTIALDRNANADMRADLSVDVASAAPGSWIAVWTSHSEVPDNRGVAVYGASLGSRCGDVNVDGVVSASDSLMLLAAATGLQRCDSCWCDVDGSGEINVLDAFAALQVASDSVATLRCECATKKPAR